MMCSIDLSINTQSRDVLNNQMFHNTPTLTLHWISRTIYHFTSDKNIQKNESELYS